MKSIQKYCLFIGEELLTIPKDIVFNRFFLFSIKNNE